MLVLVEKLPSTSEPEPKTVLPFFRVTVPVGADWPGTLAVTVAVNLTNCP